MKMDIKREIVVVATVLCSMLWASSASAKVISNNFYLETFGGEVFSGSFTTKNIENKPNRKNIGLAAFSLTGPGGIFWDQDDFSNPRLTAALNSDQTAITAINGSGSQYGAKGGVFLLELNRNPNKLFGFQWGGLLYDHSGLRLDFGTQVIPEPGILALLGIGLLGFGATRLKKRNTAS